VSVGGKESRYKAEGRRLKGRELKAEREEKGARPEDRGTRMRER